MNGKEETVNSLLDQDIILKPYSKLYKNITELFLMANKKTKSMKILFCYFAPSANHYTPIDFGYIVAALNQAGVTGYEFEFLRLTHQRSRGDTAEARASNTRGVVSADLDSILSTKPDAVFISLESMVWSKVFALGRASRIARELRKKSPSVFIGLHSYKIQRSQSSPMLESGVVDCVISGNHESAYLEIAHILAKKHVAGVTYKIAPEVPLSRATMHKGGCSTKDNLDKVPSPYLEHVFDDFLRKKQEEKGGNFRAFIVSSRGCSFGCFYCFRSVKFEKVRYFSVGRFYDEMEYLFDNFGVWRYFVLDDAFLYSKKRLREFAGEFARRVERNPGLNKVVLNVMARPETIDEEVVDILSKLGVGYLQIGLQTINPDLSHYMKRAVETGYFTEISGWLKSKNIKLHLDVVVGLPGDSVVWMNKTIDFALALGPYTMQVKQFYLNPNTLFQVNSSDYEIVVDSDDSAFDAPYVTRARGIDDDYFEATNSHIMSRINSNPDIRWKYLTKRQRFLSPGFYPAE